MTRDHDRRPRRVKEPVQVYLDSGQRGLLERMADQLGATKSDVIRQGLEALERQLANPADHPAMRIVGLAGTAGEAERSYDVAREHDRFLAESEQDSWSAPPARKRGQAKRGR